MKYDIITIGSATRDVFLVSKKFKVIASKKFPTGEGECVTLGSKIDVENAVFTTGGGATNSAASFAALGFKTACATRVGSDRSAEDVLIDLKSFGVKTDWVRKIKGGATGYSVLLTMPTGERTALVHRGVSASLSRADLPWRLDAAWVYVTSLSGQLNLIREIAKRSTGRIAYNPGQGEIKLGWKKFQSILGLIDLLILNLEEAAALSGLPYKQKEKILKFFRPSGDQIALITDGERGAYALTKKNIFFVRTRRIKVISATGAGDAFGSGFTAGLVKYKQIKPALQLAMLNAESVIQKIGAKAGLLKKWPTERELGRIKVN